MESPGEETRELPGDVFIEAETDGNNRESALQFKSRSLCHGCPVLDKQLTPRCEIIPDSVHLAGLDIAGLAQPLHLSAIVQNVLKCKISNKNDEKPPQKHKNC